MTRLNKTEITQTKHELWILYSVDGYFLSNIFNLLEKLKIIVIIAGKND